MKRQIELIRTVVAVMLAAGALAAIVWTLAIAAPSTSPPELPTLTAPAPGWQPTATTQWILTATPGPYPPPPPIVNTPGPYPEPGVFLPYVQDGEAYP